MLLLYGGSNKIKNGYRVQIEFEDASGIIEGGIVRLAGANVGYVLEAPVLNSNHRVDVSIFIRDSLKVPTNAKFEIVSLSMLGDKAIYIKYPEKPAGAFLQEGDKVKGVSPKGLAELQDQAAKLSNQVEGILKQTDTTFTNLNVTLTEYKTAATQLNTSLERLNKSLLAEDTLADASSAVQNINEVSVGLRDFSKDLGPLTQDVRVALKDFQTVAQGTKAFVSHANTKLDTLSSAIEVLPETIQTYNKVGKTLQTALESEESLLGAVTQDKEVKDDAKTFVKNLRTNGILGYKDDSDPEVEDPRDRYRGMRR